MTFAGKSDDFIKIFVLPSLPNFFVFRFYSLKTSDLILFLAVM